ncbi:MAG: hypothetical protein H0W96_00765 [Solirubrobacterales bacterium]|nr:hypothetical protein [Solirubrobacterales bacterium]
MKGWAHALRSQLPPSHRRRGGGGVRRHAARGQRARRGARHAAGSEGAHVAQKVSCTIELIAVKPPRTLYAENFGTLACTPTLGKGVQHDSSFVTPTGRFAGSFTGPYQQFFEVGTLYGHFTINYVTDPTTLAVTYDGTINIDGGTGKYKNYRGSGTLKGGSPDAIRSTITEDLTLTHK